jgi:hypothetical protein
MHETQVSFSCAEDETIEPLGMTLLFSSFPSQNLKKVPVSREHGQATILLIVSCNFKRGACLL